jgi:hypothetical protein
VKFASPVFYCPISANYLTFLLFIALCAGVSFTPGRLPRLKFAFALAIDLSSVTVIHITFLRSDCANVILIVHLSNGNKNNHV